MNIAHINNILGEVMERLESLDPANLEAIEEAQKKPSEQNGARLGAARKRLQRLYAKNTKDRPESTKVKGSGAKRG